MGSSRARNPSALGVILFFAFTHFHVCHAFTPLVSPRRTNLLGLLLSSGKDSQNEEMEDLLKKASQLRQEASELESALNTSSGGSRRPVGVPIEEAPVVPVYKDMPNSVWAFSYRFSDQPEPKEETDTRDVPKRTFFSGKLVLRMKSDGYTDIVSYEAAGSGPALTIAKAWGWDVEQSAEDDKEYLLCSIDANVPSTSGPEDQLRFYFQARLERETDTAGISLKEGTVTIKQDVVDSRAGRWSFLSPRGILAEFRYVGDFSAKPFSEN